VTATSPEKTQIKAAEPTKSTPPGRAKFQLEKRREFRYPLSVMCAKICSWVTFVCPKPVRYRIADLWGEFFYRARPKYRKNVESNVLQVLGDELPPEQLGGIVRSIYRASARNFADLLTVPHAGPGELNRATTVEHGSFQLLDDALSDGRGALVLTGHLGAFDLTGQVLSERGYKLTVVTGRTTARFVFDAVSYLRSSRGMNVVEASPSGVRKMIQAVKRGEVAVLVSDRDFFQSGIPVTFFDRQTTLPPGIARIARDTGAKIVPVYGRRVETGYRLTIEPGFSVPKTRDVDEDVRHGMEQVVETLERAISRAPDQWVMFQQVWPSAPAAPAPDVPADSSTDLAIVTQSSVERPGSHPIA
jgi:lauroyl/myristoyl acyltransferase